MGRVAVDRPAGNGYHAAAAVAAAGVRPLERSACHSSDQRAADRPRDPVDHFNISTSTGAPMIRRYTGARIAGPHSLLLVGLLSLGCSGPAPLTVELPLHLEEHQPA